MPVEIVPVEEVPVLTEEQRREYEALVDPDVRHDTVTFSDGPAPKETDPDGDLQKYLVGLVQSNEQWVRNMIDVVKPEDFTTDAHQLIVRKVFEFFQKYGGLPDRAVLAKELQESLAEKSPEQQLHVFGEMYQCLQFFVPNMYTTEYLTDMVIEFAKKNATRKLFSAALNDMKERKYNMANLIQGLEKANELTLGAKAFEGFDAVQFLEYADGLSQEWIIKGWLGAGTLTLLAGREKLGKSTLLFSLIPAFMTGQRWLEKMLVRQCPVLYLDFENPPAYVRDNLTSYLPREEFGPVRAFLDVPKKLPPALTANWLKGYMKHRGLDQHPTGVIIIDSARAAFGGLFEEVANWENSASEVRKALQPIQQVARESGWAIVVVHHQNKSGGTSGSTDWGGAVDFVWSYIAGAAKTQRLLSIGGRLLEQPDDLILEKVGPVVTLRTKTEAFAKIDADEGAEILKLIPMMNGNEVTVANGMATEKLRELTGWSIDKVKRALTRLTASQQVQRKRDGKGNNAPYIYWREALLEQ